MRYDGLSLPVGQRHRKLHRSQLDGRLYPLGAGGALIAGQECPV